MKKVKWGVLGAASIAVRKVIPGMQKGKHSEITAIASRDKRRAQEAARSWGSKRHMDPTRSFCAMARSSRLQSAAQSLACALVGESGGSREARAVREAH